MKAMKELRDTDSAKLMEKLNDSRLELAKEKAAAEIGTVKNPGRINALRKQVARIKTLQRERELKKDKAEKKTQKEVAKAGAEKK